MIYEIALLPVHQGEVDNFKQAFEGVLPLLTRAAGYQGHLLTRGIENPDLVHLIVRWRSLEDHTPGFETSKDHEMFMEALERYFSGEPQVHHIEGAPFISSKPGELTGENSSASEGNWT